tara:strand:- start:1271 stop:1783 length:513 start_codon:yes stop_codon:yes gene_type:complete
MYSKIQVNTATALKVIPSDTVHIPEPASSVVEGTADFSVAGTLTDVATTFTTKGINVGAIVYNTTANIAYYVASVDSDTEITLSPSSAGGATDSYEIYNESTLGALLWVGSSEGVMDIAKSVADVNVKTVNNNSVVFTNAKVGEYLPVQVTMLKDTTTTTASKNNCIALS